jgi:hypothetical protein
MSPNPRPPRLGPSHDRRTGRDRRRVDKGSPTGRERRVSVEPRQPEVAEIELTAEQWAAMQAAVAVAPPAALSSAPPLASASAGPTAGIGPTGPARPSRASGPAGPARPAPKRTG